MDLPFTKPPTQSGLDSKLGKTQTRRALVLAGGGAKGAYAFGALKAFRERGIEFDAVGGVSVGALNAIIWSTGQFDSGEELWKNLSFSTVYPIRLLDPRRHSRAVLVVLSGLYVALRLMWATLQGFPAPGQHIWAAITAVGISLPTFLAAYLAPNEGKIDLVGRVVVALLCAVWLWLLHSMIVSQLVKSRQIIAVLAVLIPAISIAALIRFSRLNVFAKWVLTPLAIGLLLLLALNVYAILARLLGSDMSVLSRAPLASSIRRILNSPLTLPTTIAVAHHVDVFDPDNPQWAPLGLHEPTETNFLVYPDLRRVWISKYIMLNSLDVDAAMKCCVASAALPFGIVPPVLDGTMTYVDGGIKDNVPVFPFIAAGDFDELYVVLLNPVSSDVGRVIGFDPAVWSQRDREFRVAEFPIPNGAYWYDERPYRARQCPPQVIPLRPQPPLPSIRVFCPHRALGGFLSGTLNFDGEYADRIMELGYRETLDELAKLGFGADASTRDSTRL